MKLQDQEQADTCIVIRMPLCKQLEEAVTVYRSLFLNESGACTVMWNMIHTKAVELP